MVIEMFHNGQPKDGTLSPLEISDTCQICGADQETVLHALHNCQIARAVWLNLVSTAAKQNFYSLSLNDWLLDDIDNNSGCVDELLKQLLKLGYECDAGLSSEFSTAEWFCFANCAAGGMRWFKTSLAARTQEDHHCQSDSEMVVQLISDSAVDPHWITLVRNIQELRQCR
ncbi:hypothetical protein J1N35_003061 [Gossypium stocksii]|uniref:Reverse transcriptase zinc-binding domain-containing protein n=1 Tax=Gossypium stocksii TaxID=47602 RepID=A0A9D3WP23_9ROSI|nr:hypothetical protein J1N35_003061 [Gossypium stocksii]